MPEFNQLTLKALVPLAQGLLLVFYGGETIRHLPHISTLSISPTFIIFSSYVRNSNI